MNPFSDFALSLTEDRVEELLSRATKRSDGKFVSELSGDSPLEGATQCSIEQAQWVSIEDTEDAFQSARMIRSADEVDNDNVFLRIGGTVTSAGRDDNGVTLLPTALRSMPQDFQDRTTLLFNHDVGTPIGRIVNTRVVRANGSAPARAVISADVHQSAIHASTQLTYAEMIRSGILNKYSFAWSVVRGEVIFDLSGKDMPVFDEEAEVATMPFGREYAPEINVHAMRATEASVVSVPAEATADLTVARSFARSLNAVRSNWHESAAGLLVPVAVLRATATVDRPFNPQLAMARVKAWAATGDTLDLTNDNDFTRFAQAFAGHENDGRSVEDWYGLHCDVVDGGLAWNKRAIAHCLSDLDVAERSVEKTRMCRELSLVHDIEVGS